MGKRKGIRKKKQKRINKEKVLSYVRLFIKPLLTSPQGRNGQDMGQGNLKI
jgi:hypothetical protein